jgi:anti-sigma-K factor RskA
MDLRRHPGLLDRLAAEYALGTLRGGARRRLETLSARDPAVRLALDSWQQRLDAMAELTRAQTPRVSVWDAIEARIGHRAVGSSPLARRRFDRLAFWRGWAIASTGAALAAVAGFVFTLHPFSSTPPVSSDTLAQRTPAPPLPGKVGYVAALNDGHAHTMMVLTYDDTRSMMTVHRMMPPRERPGHSMQVWGMTSSGRHESLGVLPADRVVSMKVRHRLQDYVMIAVSVEPEGGSPDPNAPTGPVVYTGRLVPAA